MAYIWRVILAGTDKKRGDKILVQTSAMDPILPPLICSQPSGRTSPNLSPPHPWHAFTLIYQRWPSPVSKPWPGSGFTMQWWLKLAQTMVHFLWQWATHITQFAFPVHLSPSSLKIDLIRAPKLLWNDVGERLDTLWIYCQLPLRKSSKTWNALG